MGFFKDLVKGVGGPLLGAAAGALIPGVGWAIGAAAGSLVGSTVAGMDAADAQRDAANQARKREKLMMWQNSMENVRQTNLAMATSAVSFQGSGADLESSGAQGVRSSLGAQGSFNNTMLAQGGQISDRYWNYMREAADARGRQALWGSLAQGFAMLNTVLPQGGTTTTTTPTTLPPSSPGALHRTGPGPTFGIGAGVEGGPAG